MSELPYWASIEQGEILTVTLPRNICEAPWCSPIPNIYADEMIKLVETFPTKFLSDDKRGEIRCRFVISWIMDWQDKLTQLWMETKAAEFREFFSRNTVLMCGMGVKVFELKITINKKYDDNGKLVDDLKNKYVRSKKLGRISALTIPYMLFALVYPIFPDVTKSDYKYNMLEDIRYLYNNETIVHQKNYDIRETPGIPDTASAILTNAGLIALTGKCY